ncbi:hypothetical protein CYLTODRAFT_487345 [Cylindrobasidium torrendii FP15055 ss-10]|uniref:MYND-type domain-containing protein n=1 Tax=Cylindrobasidium torrendii FP15055 ss-10 TaxID=1314674 RepID=A0A0D7BM57_9AGAR|nr:hypothetical protein CYLTODRAFT_487345 [Cylindrobasidium torrendii FP15055 ss-10]
MSSTQPERTFRPFLTEGVDLGSSFKMPDYAVVEKQARRALQAMKEPDPHDCLGMDQSGNPIGMLHPAMAHNLMFSELFRFSYFCRIEDVPPEIYPSVIWALERFICALLEAPEVQLRSCHHILPHQKGFTMIHALHVMVLISRHKLASHYLSPEMDRPHEALRIIKLSLAAVEKFRKDHPRSQQPGEKRVQWVDNPGLYSQYVAALARSRTDDLEAKKCLNLLLDGAPNSKNLPGYDGLLVVVSSRLYLARVLRRLGEHDEAKSHEHWLISWFKKNPVRIPEYFVKQWFSTDMDPKTDPVFVGLGGKTWLAERVSTYRSSQRQRAHCGKCERGEPIVKLSRCAGCQYVQYCSKECQKSHWPDHKSLCKERSMALKIAEAAGSKEETKLALDWIKWRDSNQPCNKECLVHALGIHSDPSRGRTHIVVKEIGRTPPALAKDPLDNYHIISMGVFPIASIYREIEYFMMLEDGGGPAFIKEIFDNVKEGMNPCLDMMFGTSVQAFINMSVHSQTHATIGAYDPKWRRLVNRVGPPPKDLSLATLSRIYKRY